jgi:predicted dehydrogenase
MRVLFTGLGSIGRRHLRLLREREEVDDILAFRSGTSASPTPEGVTEHSELEAALEANPDVAFVTNPTALHVETALQCGRAGCDLFIEKPLSHSLEGVAELCSVAASEDLVTCVACQLRFDPILRWVQESLESGRIGEILSHRAYSGSYLPDWRPDQDYTDSYSARGDLGGGVVLDLIHEIDYTYWLFGDVDCLSAEVDKVSQLDIETADIAEVVLRTEEGTIGNIHLDYMRRTPRRTLEVIGSEGTIHADLIEQSVTVDGPDEKTTKSFEYSRDAVFREQLDAFLGHVENGTACQNDVWEGKRTLQIALDIRAEMDE